MCGPWCFREFVVNTLQALAPMQHRVRFAREQRIQAQFVEDVLQNVPSVAPVGHAPANEVLEPGLLPLDHFGDPLVLFDCHPLESRRALHLGL
jgi:hypothetical protein